MLAGLSNAPQFFRKEELMFHCRPGHGSLWADDVDCVVVPGNACGGAGTLSFSKRQYRKVGLPDSILVAHFISPENLCEPQYPVVSHMDSLVVWKMPVIWWLSSRITRHCWRDTASSNSSRGECNSSRRHPRKASSRCGQLDNVYVEYMSR